MTGFRKLEEIGEVVFKITTQNGVEVELKKGQEQGTEYIELPSSDPYCTTVISGGHNAMMSLLHVLKALEI